jgi:hypothetical protein
VIVFVGLSVATAMVTGVAAAEDLKHFMYQILNNSAISRRNDVCNCWFILIEWYLVDWGKFNELT